MPLGNLNVLHRWGKEKNLFAHLETERARQIISQVSSRSEIMFLWFLETYFREHFRREILSTDDIILASI